MAQTASTSPKPIAGYIGFALGAATLIIVLVHFWAGPFAPQQSVSISVGTVAAEIRQAASRAMTGAPQPAPEAREWDIDKVIEVSSATFAGLAIIVGLLGIVRHEPKRPAAGGIALGLSAVTFQFLTWMVLLLVGAFIYYAIIENVGGILGD